jgi:hypothetical protein
MRYQRSIAVVSYFVPSAVWVYWILDRQVFFGNPAGDWAVLGVVGVLHLVVGFGIGRWWALLLPFVLVFLALPLGYPSANRGEPFPIWWGLLFFSPILIALLATGLGVRKLVSS